MKLNSVKAIIESLRLFLPLFSDFIGFLTFFDNQLIFVHCVSIKHKVC